MNKEIEPKVKQVKRNVAMHMQYIFKFFWVGGCHKHNILPLGPIQPSFPSTKELHDLDDLESGILP